MTPKDLMNEKKLSILEEAAKMFTHIHYIDEIYPSEIKDIVSDMEQSFIDGSNWQKSNMWIPIEEELPDVDKQCFVITKNGKCSASNMYIPKDCHGNVLGEKEWKGSLSFKESIVAWMPIPEFNIKT
jgi:hypothetical protein